MNNDEFKKFIGPIVDEVINRLGGMAEVKKMHDMLAGQMVYFVAGAVYGMVVRQGPIFPMWRETDRAPIDRLNQEEIRRTFDLVHLKLGTGSSTS